MYTCHPSELEALEDFAACLEKLGIDSAEKDRCIRLHGSRSFTSLARGLAERSGVVTDVTPDEELLIDEAENEMLVKARVQDHRKPDA